MRGNGYSLLQWAQGLDLESSRFAGRMPCALTSKHAWVLVVFLAVPEAAEDDCESFLSVRSTRKSTSGIIQYTTNGLCIPNNDTTGKNMSKNVSVAVRDNHLDFSAFAGATLDASDEVKFDATWWSITPGQPIEERCVIDDEETKPNRVKADPHRRM